MDSNEINNKIPDGSPPIRLRPTSPCPICRKSSAQKSYPFCSVRCANVDLNRWLSGAYAIPVGEDDEENELPEITE